VEKDKRKRRIFEKYEKQRLCLKALCKDNRLPLSLRLLYKLKLQMFKKNSSKTRIKNRCVFTGRARSTIRFFRMSRLQVRDLYVKGLLYGVRKSSW
jgi:ribosomal protein S14